MNNDYEIVYITNARLPTEKAHGIATIKLSEAFGHQGAKVDIIAPWRFNALKENIYQYYGSENVFSIKFLPSIDLLWLPFGKKFFFALQLISFSLVASFYALVRYGVHRRNIYPMFFSHDHIPLFFLSFLGNRFIYDIHDYPRQNFLYRRVLQRAEGVVVQTQWKQEKLTADFHISREHIVYWPNGVDIKRFDISLSKQEARAFLNLSQERKIVLYSGQLFQWKGVTTLAKAGDLLEREIHIYILGGNKEDIKKISATHNERNNCIIFVGQQPWSVVPLWLKAADILVIPNTGKEVISLYYTSPMKLFEYMAAKRPIVASRIPSIQEIVNEHMVFFAEPDNPQSFADAINTIFHNFIAANEKAEKAFVAVQQYTWPTRAQHILVKIKEWSGVPR